jgi:hypothetical protein
MNDLDLALATLADDGCPHHDPEPEPDGDARADLAREIAEGLADECRRNRRLYGAA